MASLQSLPAELLLSVAEILRPNDAFHFAAINKTLWQLCDSLIDTHRRMYPKYRYICTDSDNRVFWNLLNDLLDDPNIANYVSEVQIDASERAYYDPDVPWYVDVASTVVRPPSEDVSRYISASDDNIFLSTPAFISWDDSSGNDDVTYSSDDLHRAIEYGSLDPILVLIFTKLHELETLRFVFGGRVPWLMYALTELSVQCPILHHPFQQLRKVQIAHSDAENNVDCNWALLFIRIPSLEYFSGHMIGGNAAVSRNADDPTDIPKHWHASETPTSNLKTLLFSQCMISAGAIEIILSNCKALEIFEYEAGGSQVSEDVEYDPRGIMGALVKHCAHSLERLVLDRRGCWNIQDIDDGDHPVHSLSRLRKLKTLRCAFYDLIDYGGLIEGSQAFNSYHSLPLSLTHLHIDIDSDDEDVRSLLLENLLASKKHEHLPNLEQLFLELTDLADEEKIDMDFMYDLELGFRFKPVLREDVFPVENVYLSE